MHVIENGVYWFERFCEVTEANTKLKEYAEALEARIEALQELDRYEADEAYYRDSGQEAGYGG